MADGGISYETKTVRALRGMEGRTFSKWQRQGWEVVGQSQGRLHTEIVIRRPKPKVRKGVILASIASLVLLFVLFAFEPLLGLDDDADPSEPAKASAAYTTNETASSDTTSSAVSPNSPTKATKTALTLLTVKNNSELASILKVGNYCDDSIDKFAKKYEGQTIAFDANIGAMNPHGNAKTRYDILLSAGQYSETTSPGPAFQFRDENTTWDLNYQGNVPDTIGVGTNLYIKAEVKEYEASSCLFLLEPVETTVRMPR